MNTEVIAAEILRQCVARAPNRTICPSEVARALWPDDWRAHMAQVRATGLQLAMQGQILITQRGEVLPPTAVIRGAIRYRLPT